MKWRKLGRIHEPVAVGNWAASHASLPIPLCLDSHRWRIYFSPRDARNRSHIGFFEIDLRSPQRTLRVADRPVIGPGGLGTFDEDGAMGSWVVREDGRLLLYYIGWNRATSVPFRNAIGLAESRDGGESFARISSGPIVDRGMHDPFFVASPCVLREPNRWRMWYLSGVVWEASADGPRHGYHIKYAESDDGFDWRRDGRVCIDLEGPEEIALARPCVLHDGNTYRMWYAAAEAVIESATRSPRTA